MFPLTDDILDRHIRSAKKYAYLTASEEIELARKWRATSDRAALDRLLGAHLRLAISIAQGFRGYGIPLAELVGEANVGLMQAAEKFDPEKGFRFSTYAQWWIRAAVQEHILHNWSMVKVGTTAAQKTLFFRLRSAKTRLQIMEAGELSPASVALIAKDLEVAETEVITMNRRLALGDASLNVSVGEEGDAEWQDLLEDDRPDQETLLLAADESKRRNAHLRAALEQLDPRDRAIIIARQLTERPVTLDELGQRFQVSKERIRQLENRAFSNLQKAVLAMTKLSQQAANDACAARCAA